MTNRILLKTPHRDGLLKSIEAFKAVLCKVRIAGDVDSRKDSQSIKLEQTSKMEALGKFHKICKIGK